MMIRVIYMDKTCGRVRSGELGELIARGQLAAFFREDGWVDVKVDPIRGRGGTYEGPERRGPRPR